MEKKMEKEKYNYQRQKIFEGEYQYNHKLRGKYYINDFLEFKGEYLFDR